MTDYFVFRSEVELGKGHADLSLEPLVARYPHLRRGYLIELKYLKRSDSADQSGVTAVVAEAKAQLAPENRRLRRRCSPSLTFR